MAEAEKIQYPVLIKAVMGGGGKVLSLHWHSHSHSHTHHCTRTTAHSAGADDRVILTLVRSCRVCALWRPRKTSWRLCFRPSARPCPPSAMRTFSWRNTSPSTSHHRSYAAPHTLHRTHTFVWLTLVLGWLVTR
jgi:hypothetical protein